MSLGLGGGGGGGGRIVASKPFECVIGAASEITPVCDGCFFRLFTTFGDGDAAAAVDDETTPPFVGMRNSFKSLLNTIAAHDCIATCVTHDAPKQSILNKHYINTNNKNSLV